MTPRSAVRRALALVAVLGFVVPTMASAAPASAAPFPAAAQAEPEQRVTFGIGPGGQAYVDRRSFVSFTAPPGAHLLDKVAIYNQSNTPLDLLVYPSDATNSRAGALDIAPRAQTNRDMGAWVLLGEAAQTGRLATDARSTVRVRVPAQSRQTGIGRVLLPMRVVVPQDATPGDHVAGVVVSLLSQGSNPSSQNIELEQRVALRLYLQVAGQVEPGLAVKIVKAEYLGGSGLGLRGTTRVTYQVRNTGNVRLGAVPSLKVTAPFGLGSWTASGKDVDELLPGGAALRTTDVVGTPPTIFQHTTVTVTAKAALGSRLVDVPAASDTVRLWAITWQEIVFLIALLLLVAYRRWRKLRGRRARHLKNPDSARQVATVGAVVAVLAFVGLAGAAGKAHAETLGPIQVSPLSGTDATLISGYLEDARCPKGTGDSYWTVDGPDLPRDQAFLAPGNATGTGPQVFRGASLANLKTTNSGAFSGSGTYVLRFSCVRSPDGKVTSSYQAQLRYKTGGAGSFQVVGAKPVPVHVLDPKLSPAPEPVPASAQPSAGSAGTAGTPGGSAEPSSVPTATKAPAGGGPVAAPSRDEGSAGIGWWVAVLALLLVAAGAWLLRRRDEA